MLLLLLRSIIFLLLRLKLLGAILLVFSIGSAIFCAFLLLLHLLFPFVTLRRISFDHGRLGGLVQLLQGTQLLIMVYGAGNLIHDNFLRSRRRMQGHLGWGFARRTRVIEPTGHGVFLDLLGILGAGGPS